jgi:protein-disulfide isomerase
VGDHPDRAAIYFKHYPLTQHRFAKKAARAAEAARLQGRFWEMHDQLFSHQGGLNDGIFSALAEEIGLDVVKFEQDMGSKEVRSKIASDREEGETLGLWGTPFFVLDGAPFNGSLEALFLRLKQ